MTSLHQQDGQLMLVAQLAGSEHGYLWRVCELKSRGVDAAAPTGDMLGELACRIFTDLAVPGTVSWRAVQAFSEGLRSYRESVQSPQERLLGLTRAERCFIKASAEDERYGLAFYNLGVVYRELERYEPLAPAEAIDVRRSESAFRRAIEVDSARLDSYHALARTWFDQGSEQAVVSAAELAWAATTNAASPRLRARAYNLIGLARKKLRTDPAVVDDRDRWLARRALIQAWKALLIQSVLDAALGQRRTPDYAPQAASCAASLGLVYYVRASCSSGVAAWNSFRQATRLLRQAVRLHPSDPSLYFELGRIQVCRALREGDSRVLARGRRALEAAANHAPDKQEYWAHLARALSTDCPPNAPRDEYGAERCLRLALGSPFDASAETVSLSARALQNLGRAADATTVRARPSAGTTVMGLTTGDHHRSVLHRLLESQSLDNWVRAQAALALAQGSIDFRERGDRLRDAIGLLEGGHSVEVRRRGLWAQLAWAQMQSNDLAGALSIALRAVTRDPLSDYERKVLGDVYFRLNDMEQALEAYHTALALLPPASEATQSREAEIHLSIGNAHYVSASSARDRSHRVVLARKAIEHLVNSLNLRVAEDRSGAAQAHRFLGLVHILLNETDRAITRLRIAQSREPTWPMTGWLLAVAYIRHPDHAQAEEQLARTIDEVASLAQGQSAPTHDVADSDRSPPTPVDPTAGELDPLDPGGPSVILVLLRLALASSYLLRSANLDKAQEFNVSAREALDSSAPPPSNRAELEAQILAQEGWTMLQRYKRAGDQRQLERAAALLEQSICKHANGLAYCILGLALERKARRAQDDAEKDDHLSRAREALQTALAGDPWGEFSVLTDELTRQLDAL